MAYEFLQGFGAARGGPGVSSWGAEITRGAPRSAAGCGCGGCGGCGCGGLGAGEPVLSGPDGSCPPDYTNYFGLCMPTGGGQPQDQTPVCPTGQLWTPLGCQAIPVLPGPPPQPQVATCPPGQIEPWPGAGCGPIVGWQPGGGGSGPPPFTPPTPTVTPPSAKASAGGDKWLVPMLIGGGALVLLVAVVASRPKRAAANRRRRSRSRRR